MSKKKKDKKKADQKPVPAGSAPASPQFDPNVQPILRATGGQGYSYGSVAEPPTGELMGGSTPMSPGSMKGKALLGRNGNLKDKAAFKAGPITCRER